jgi:Glycosyltransferases involved in cell wall biogenesis
MNFNLPGVKRDPLACEVDLTVVVTCYNEHKFILDTLDLLTSALDQWGGRYEVIVMDDCSTDHSAELVENYIAKRALTRLRLHRNQTNLGFGGNFVEGAFLGRGKYYRLCCGDNAESAEAFAHIFSLIGKADLIIPYQVQSEVSGRSWQRRVLSRLFTGIVNLLSGNHILYYNSLPVFRREHVIRFPPQTLGFGFQADIVTRMLQQDITYLQSRHRGPRELKGKDSTALTMRNLLSVVHTFAEIAIRRVSAISYGKKRSRARELLIDD